MELIFVVQNEIRCLKIEFVFFTCSLPAVSARVHSNSCYAHQQDGFNWLMFLNRYQLHGVLCDDMGFWKILETICLVLACCEDLVERKQKVLPSIVI